MLQEEEERKKIFFFFFFFFFERQDNEIVHKQQMLERKKENNGAVTKVSDEIKLTYTNIDGIIARKLELIDYLKRRNLKGYA